MYLNSIVCVFFLAAKEVMMEFKNFDSIFFCRPFFFVSKAVFFVSKFLCLISCEYPICTNDKSHY